MVKVKTKVVVVKTRCLRRRCVLTWSPCCHPSPGVGCVGCSHRGGGYDIQVGVGGGGSRVLVLVVGMITVVVVVIVSKLVISSLKLVNSHTRRRFNKTTII